MGWVLNLSEVFLLSPGLAYCLGLRPLSPRQGATERDSTPLTSASLGGEGGARETPTRTGRSQARNQGNREERGKKRGGPVGGAMDDGSDIKTEAQETYTQSHPRHSSM